MVTTPEQLAASLVRRKRFERVQADARANEVRGRLEQMIGEEARLGRFRRAILIGSLAWGGSGKGRMSISSWKVSLPKRSGRSMVGWYRRWGWT